MPVRVDRTQEIERALANVYLDLFKSIKKDTDDPANVNLLKFRYNRKVYDASRKAISQVFAEGQSYVGRVLGVEAYPSTKDVELIKSETDKAVNMFWRRVDFDSVRLIQIQQQEQKLVTEDKPKEQFDTQFYMQSAAQIATTGALAISTLTKTKQLVEDPQLKDEVKTPTITWRTQMDERVCPICNALDGQEWDYEDPSIPVPARNGPGGSHGNCRCWLELG